MLLKVVLLVIFISLPIGLPPWAANKEIPAASQPVIEDASSDIPDGKENRETTTREETKRRHDLSKVLLLWFLRNHPLQ